MKRSLVIPAAAAALAVSSSGAAPSAGAHRSACLQPPAQPTPAGQTRMYGHIKSLTRKGGRFELRFDPAWWLSGVPAERAAVEDKMIRPGEPVPNDYYIVDDGHRLLTFVVPVSAKVTFLPGGRPCATSISVAKLAQRVSGGKVRLGFWLRIGARYPSPVLALEEQYQP